MCYKYHFHLGQYFKLNVNVNPNFYYFRTFSKFHENCQLLKTAAFIFHMRLQNIYFLITSRCTMRPKP